MRDVAEVRAQHRVERLRNEPLHIAETLNHARRAHVVDMHDHGEWQTRFIGIPSDEIDRSQTFVVAMRFALACDPVQHEVGRGHHHDASGVSVERVLTWAKWPLPYAPFSFR